MPTPLGEIIELRSTHASATIATLAAALAGLEVHGRELAERTPPTRIPSHGHGIVLAPWPNRVVDGRYTFDGEEQQLALTEPTRGHALHGLAAWLDFTAVDRSAGSVTLAATIEAQEGYPHRVEVAVAFELDEDGLHTTVTGTNSGPSPAPWGTGPHPYLVAGDGRVDDWTLELPASQVLTVTEDRLIPIGLADVAAEGGGVFDFRAPRTIADTFIDHAFTGLRRGTDGRTTVSVRSGEGTGVAMTWDKACPWVQVHTADRDVAELNRLGLAVEPMTCPPNAYNSGTDLTVLAPGESATASWTITAL